MDGRGSVPEVIVALDVEDVREALRLVQLLRGRIHRYKIGSRLFTAAGPEIVSRIRSGGGAVFLDLKFHDIPATVAGSVRAAVGHDVWMMTIHTSGGLEMMRAAAEAAAEEAVKCGVDRPLLVGVTVLTSLSAPDLAVFGPIDGGIEDLVLRLAAQASEAGLDGVVASVAEAERIKRDVGEGFIVVTPGIRPAGGAVHDQKRVATPAMAAHAGADFIVVGRSIIGADSPPEAAEQILNELLS
ncbi:MAG: orotidine-5'-phosphate decarboxylase [bacterium]|nr:MAG: orotidine-5'-phosphate decarboxylase [bacterium]